MASTRLEGKLLLEVNGKSILQRVWEQVIKCTKLDKIIIATDSEELLTHAKGFNAAVELSSPQHQSGTDRCAEVAMRYPEFDIIINVQGDEPFIQPSQLELLIQLLALDTVQIASLLTRIYENAELQNPAVVKVTMDNGGKALYFSRHAIPFQRNVRKEDWYKTYPYYKHLGLYGFKRNSLLDVSKLSTSSLERAECLEQLRWMENGFAIHLAETNIPSIGIDTSEDLDKARLYAIKNNL
ncbi:MAG: 3-deoxy-manno-octulosonate cytidylyltransferase [Bacteroidota bacterium]|nr:3-deoxy-manno-octulosonate cytidylyltransferase [Bacteroidota bacterium]